MLLRYHQNNIMAVFKMTKAQTSRANLNSTHAEFLNDLSIQVDTAFRELSTPSHDDEELLQNIDSIMRETLEALPNVKPIHQGTLEACVLSTQAYINCTDESAKDLAMDRLGDALDKVQQLEHGWQEYRETLSL